MGMLPSSCFSASSASLPLIDLVGVYLTHRTSNTPDRREPASFSTDALLSAHCGPSWPLRTAYGRFGVGIWGGVGSNFTPQSRPCTRVFLLPRIPSSPLFEMRQITSLIRRAGPRMPSDTRRPRIVRHENYRHNACLDGSSVYGRGHTAERGAGFKGQLLTGVLSPLIQLQRLK